MRKHPKIPQNFLEVLKMIKECRKNLGIFGTDLVRDLKKARFKGKTGKIIDEKGLVQKIFTKSGMFLR